MDDKELERLAQEELLAEVKRGKVREETMGMLAWKKSPVPRTNKRFLTNMLMSTKDPKRKKVELKDSSTKRNKGASTDHEIHKRSVKPDDDNRMSHKSSSSRKSQHRHDDERSPRKSKHKKKHKKTKR